MTATEAVALSLNSNSLKNRVTIDSRILHFSYKSWLVDDISTLIPLSEKYRNGILLAQHGLAQCIRDTLWDQGVDPAVECDRAVATGTLVESTVPEFRKMLTKIESLTLWHSGKEIAVDLQATDVLSAKDIRQLNAVENVEDREMLRQNTIQRRATEW